MLVFPLLIGSALAAQLPFLSSPSTLTASGAFVSHLSVPNSVPNVEEGHSPIPAPARSTRAKRASTSIPRSKSSMRTIRACSFHGSINLIWLGLGRTR